MGSKGQSKNYFPDWVKNLWCSSSTRANNVYCFQKSQWGSGIRIFPEWLVTLVSKNAEGSSVDGVDECCACNNLHNPCNSSVDYSAETFLNLARPFLGEIANRFETLGTRIEKWKPRLLKNIPADQIPPKYGGTNPAWKPLPRKWPWLGVNGNHLFRITYYDFLCEFSGSLK